MSTTSEPHLACHHVGDEFDWWRCKEGGYVGRPPSPFPASFETPRRCRTDSADSRHGIWALAGAKGKGAVGAGASGVAINGAGTCGASKYGAGTCGAGNYAAGTCNAGANGAGTCGARNYGSGTCGAGVNGAGTCGDVANGDTFPCDENIRYTICDNGSGTHRLYWPLYHGPGITEPVCDGDLGNIDTSGELEKGKKTPRLAHKRPPWIPTKMPNKWGVSGYPPPYTNYCRETLFNTRTADPGKVTIKTTF